MTISLIMITKNEEKNLPACLDSVKGFVDEIIIVDGGSSDRTVEIAKSYGAQVSVRQFDSFTLQKGAALEKATKDWVLNLDADEFLSEELKKELLETEKSPKYDAYYLPSKNIFLGRKMKHSGLKGNYKIRFAKREGASYQGGKVHEVLMPKDKNSLGYLKNVINHTPYRDIRHYFEKFNIYTSLGAETMHERGKKFNPLQLLRPPFEFFKIYILRLAVLDGIQGFMWALFSSLYPAVKYAKLWELNKNK